MLEGAAMKIHVGYDATINVGNYESIRPSFWIEDDVPPQDYEKERARLDAEAQKGFIEQFHKLLDLVTKMRKKVEAINGHPSTGAAA